MTLNLPIDIQEPAKPKKANAQRWPFLLAKKHYPLKMLHVEHQYF